MFDPSREADKFMYAVSSIAMWTKIVYALVAACCFIAPWNPYFITGPFCVVLLITTIIGIYGIVQYHKLMADNNLFKEDIVAQNKRALVKAEDFFDTEKMLAICAVAAAFPGLLTFSIMVFPSIDLWTFVAAIPIAIALPLFTIWLPARKWEKMFNSELAREVFVNE